jgi:hypothetical protein
LADFVLAFDFNGLGMIFHVLHARGRGESVALTMPWMGLKVTAGGSILAPCRSFQQIGHLP